MENKKIHVISGFRREVDNCALLGYYVQPLAA